MRHLFIINPAALHISGRVKAVSDEIKAFFQGYSHIEYDILVTRWARDASGYVRRYALQSDGLVRVHSFGGSGTLYEIVNGTIGLPNVQIAAYPMGGSNDFLRYFGADKTHLFSSLRNQVFSGVTPIDAVRCGNNYGISFGLVGLESEIDKAGTIMIERTGLPTDFCYIWSALSHIVRRKDRGQRYRITLDGMSLDGEYTTMMIAGGPCYGKGMNPAVDAHPNDGRLDIYLMKDLSKGKLLASVHPYVSGNYRKLPDRVLHYSGKKIAISSDSVMCMSVDGESFYDHSIEYEVIPYAIDFVCPSGIDIARLPRIYNKPGEGLIGDG